MFKAIGRWGSQVRSAFNIPFFSSLFGSKSKKYGDLDNEDEEIFVDAEEDLIHDTGHTEDNISRTANASTASLRSELPVTGLQKIKDDCDGNSDAKESCDIADNAKKTETSNPEIEITVITHEHVGNNKDSVITSKDEEEGQSEDDESDKEDVEKDGDDHHVNHKDTKKTMKTSKSSNVLLQSPSTSVFQKVHRRVNSYTQRQYAKFDNALDDHNDNLIENEASTDSADGYSGKEAQKLKHEKKVKKRKKIARRTRKAVRGCWKWFKRSMVAYALTFNFPSLFVINVASSTKK